MSVRVALLFHKRQGRANTLLIAASPCMREPDRLSVQMDAPNKDFSSQRVAWRNDG